MLMRWGAALLLALIASVPAQGAVTVVLPRGARVGVVNLLDPEVMHFHAARRLTDSFLKTYAVTWRIDLMLAGALKDRLQQLGLVEVPLAPSGTLIVDREDCIVNSALSRGLDRKCVPPIVAFAVAHGLAAVILLGPGLNNSTHGRRLGRLPDYLRGWGFVSRESGQPTLFNLTELLFIGVSGNAAQLLAKAWGGSDQLPWSAFVAPPDIRSIPQSQLDQLQPLFGNMLAGQCSELLDQVEVAH